MTSTATKRTSFARASLSSAALGFLLVLARAVPAQAQIAGPSVAPGPAPYGGAYSGQPTTSAPTGYSGFMYTPPPRTRSNNEMTLLFATSAAYGVGMGTWVSAEAGIHDPGLFLIAPALLGLAAPVGAYALDQPKMRRGVPTAISAGILLGAGEGLGIAGTQIVVSSSADAWKFRGLSRAMALGSTVGGIGGWLAGTWLEPPPNTALLAMSGAVWGTAVGSMFGYGASPGNYGWGRANDSAAIGGLVGYNVGALGAAGLGTLATLTERQLMWMWAGAGIGAAASLPVFLFYAGDGGPPARRGFVFMGTACTLGIVAGAVFSSNKAGLAQRNTSLHVAQVEPAFELLGVIPWYTAREGGLSAVGTFR